MEKKNCKVLFIGNSYTYFHEIWKRFAALSEAVGIKAEVDHVTKGGYFLSQMNDPQNEFGSQVAQKLAKPHFDFVFLQEQSLAPILSNEEFETSVRALAEKIRAVGATPILYQTWGRKTGHERLERHGWTNRTMTELLVNAYYRIGAECKIPVSPVGDAFYDVYTNHPEIELYDPDLTHPSPAGTYLAALCHFATVFGISPISNTYVFGVEDTQQARILQEAAHRAVFGA